MGFGIKARYSVSNLLKNRKQKLFYLAMEWPIPWALKTSKMKKYIYKMLIYNKYKRYFNGLISETDVR